MTIQGTCQETGKTTPDYSIITGIAVNTGPRMDLGLTPPIESVYVSAHDGFLIMSGDAVELVSELVDQEDREELEKVMDELVGENAPLRKSTFHLADRNEKVVTYNPDYESGS